MRWQQPAAGPGRAGAARRALGWAAAQAAARAGAPRTPRLRRVTFRRQRGLAGGAGGRGRVAARAPGGALGAPGRREAGVPREEAPRTQARGEGREASPWAPRPPQRAGPRVAAGAAALPCLSPPDSDLASPGRAVAAARGALMARFRAAERALSRSLSGLETCPNASRGLLSMESRASRRPQRAGSGRARLGEQAWRPRRRRRRAAAPSPSSGEPPAVPPPCPHPGSAGAELNLGSTGRPTRSGPSSPSHRFSHRYC